MSNRRLAETNTRDDRPAQRQRMNHYQADDRNGLPPNIQLGEPEGGWQSERRPDHRVSEL
jgi:hypothetical protein